MFGRMRFPVEKYEKNEITEPALKLIKDGENYIHGSTMILGVYAIGYGTLTFIFGDALWTGADSVYDSAQTVPGAPQTWGAIAIVDGLFIIIGVYLRRSLLILVGASTQAIWSFLFGFTFLIDILHYQESIGATAVLIHSIFWIAFMNRAIFAWKRYKNPIRPDTHKRAGS